MADSNSSNATRYKGNDIDPEGDGTVNSADNATLYKGNDIDSDGDGTVDNASNLGGNPPSHYEGGSEEALAYDFIGV